MNKWTAVSKKSVQYAFMHTTHPNNAQIASKTYINMQNRLYYGRLDRLYNLRNVRSAIAREV